MTPKTRSSVTIAIYFLLIPCANAPADLGYCRVLNQSTQINSRDFGELRKILHDAFDKSPANDGTYAFVIDIDPNLPEDTFQFQRGGLLGNSAFTITGGSPKALRAGVAEFALWFQKLGKQPLNQERQKVALKGRPVTLPVTASLKIDGSEFSKTGRLPMAVTIENGFQVALRFSTYSHSPLPWNGETTNVSLVNIRRADEDKLLYEARPEVDVPKYVAGLSNSPIPPGKSLTIRSDASKWNIHGGWKPGKYTVDARIEQLSIDEGRCRTSVATEPIQFEIR